MFAPFIAAMALAAYVLCPTEPATRVILLPDADGKVGAVTIDSQAGKQQLDTAYQEVAADRGGRLAATARDADFVAQRYGATLAARPVAPVSFTLYFLSGSNELTPESKPVIDQLKAELARRSAPEIRVIGHTDRVGSVEQNDALSKTRAGAVRDILIAAGIKADLIESAGRGEREPLVPTADEVAEQRNRRVEINVR